jgi:transcriptional regulator with XRE-family HTH domain
MDDFGRRIRERRMSEGLTQGELARRAGISRAYLVQIESGERKNIAFQIVERLRRELSLGEEPEQNLPAGLATFAEEEGLTTAEIKSLAGLRLRGLQPSTQEEWRVVYRLVCTYLESVRRAK